MRIGIVGLPNVGKTTLFNAVANQTAQVRNVPFTTIEPNVGIVPLPDERLEKIARIMQSRKATPATIEFIDVAGLVRGAHAGEGLGNQFLAHIRDVDALVHMVRFFEDPNVTHLAGAVSPTADTETVELELTLADLATVEKALQKAEHAAKSNDKKASTRAAVLKKTHQQLAAGRPIRALKITDEEYTLLAELKLLTSKPVLYAANLNEQQFQDASASTRTFAQRFAPTLPLNAKIEYELAQLPPADQKEFLAVYGMAQSGLERLVQESFHLLNLITFFTANKSEARSWTLPAGSTALDAAGKVHSDMAAGFIRAETVSADQLLAAGSHTAARTAGRVRDEGKTYIVQSYDVLLFKFSPPA